MTNYAMDLPLAWNTTLKKVVKKAYKTGSLVDIRKALKQIDMLQPAKRGRKINVGILRTFTLETIRDHLCLSFASIPCQPTLLFGELENIEQELLDNNSTFLKTNPDLIVVLWRLEELHPRLSWEIDSMNLEQRRDECNALIERVRELVSAYSGDAQLFLSTIALPSHWVGSLHDQHRIYGIANIVCKFNTILYEMAAENQIKIFDFAQWITHSGDIARDNKMDFFARQPIAKQRALSFANAFAKVIRPLVRPQAKVLAVDLDNTFWGGVLGEDGVENLKIGNDYPGIIYWRIQQLILALKHRGIILVLLSKNNLSDVQAAFNFLCDMPLKITDFTLLKVNWREKYENLMDAAKELNLGLDSFVFLDDQPFEQEHILHALPEVKVLKVIDPLDIFNTLSGCNDFDSFSLLKEDLVRVRDYEMQVQRKELQKNHTKEVFLTSLDLKAIIRPIKIITMQRVVQMLEKTNQFNLTTKRHNSAEVKRMLNNPENILLALSLSDKFGDQGIVGICIALRDKKNEGGMFIDSFLLSCRAIGRGAENALWVALLKQLEKLNISVLRASYVPSSKNMQVSGFFERLGMDVEFTNGSETQYVLNLPLSIGFPKWISVDISSL